MGTWHALEVLIVALLVGGSAAFVLRALWQSLHTLSQPAPKDGCSGCGGHCSQRSTAAHRD